AGARRARARALRWTGRGCRRHVHDRWLCPGDGRRPMRRRTRSFATLIAGRPERRASRVDRLQPERPRARQRTLRERRAARIGAALSRRPILTPRTLSVLEATTRRRLRRDRARSSDATSRRTVAAGPLGPHW